MKETRCFYENLRENEIVNLEIGNLINTTTLTEDSNSLEGLITR